MPDGGTFKIDQRRSQPSWKRLSVAYARAAESGDTPAPRGDLDWFRRELYRSCTARADALFELTDGAPRGAGVPDGGERPPIFPSS